MYKPGIDRPLRIALVADLHSRPCANALRALNNARADIIAIAGDLMELPGFNDRYEDLYEQMRGAPGWKLTLYRALLRMDSIIGKLARRKASAYDNNNAYELLKSAAKLAPTYYAPGNHERGMTDIDRAKIKRTGAVLLENAHARIDASGALIGGLRSKFDGAWLEEFSNIKAPVKILICHHPEYFKKHVRPDAFTCVLSGHAHGGQWRIFGAPVFAPGQGFFPKYSSGVYDNALVVSRGLSNTAHVPRFGNSMQLVIVQIVSTEVST